MSKRRQRIDRQQQQLDRIELALKHLAADLNADRVARLEQEKFDKEVAAIEPPTIEELAAEAITAEKIALATDDYVEGKAGFALNTWETDGYPDPAYKAPQYSDNLIIDPYADESVTIHGGPGYPEPAVQVTDGTFYMAGQNITALIEELNAHQERFEAIEAELFDSQRAFGDAMKRISVLEAQVQHEHEQNSIRFTNINDYVWELAERIEPQSAAQAVVDGMKDMAARAKISDSRQRWADSTEDRPVGKPAGPSPKTPVPQTQDTQHTYSEAIAVIHENIAQLKTQRDNLNNRLIQVEDTLANDQLEQGLADRIHLIENRIESFVTTQGNINRKNNELHDRIKNLEHQPTKLPHTPTNPNTYTTIGQNTNQTAQTPKHEESPYTDQDGFPLPKHKDPHHNPKLTNNPQDRHWPPNTQTK